MFTSAIGHANFGVYSLLARMPATTISALSTNPRINRWRGGARSHSAIAMATATSATHPDSELPFDPARPSAMNSPHGEAMKIDAFDESPDHRNILPYDPAYADVFAQVQRHVHERLEGVELVHIGSTAIRGLRGKPMVDVAAITHTENLRAAQQAFETLGFHRRAVWVDKDEKPYVCGSIEHEGRRFNVNIHICHRGDPVHKDSLAFMDILDRRPDLQRKYEEAKDRAHAIDPVNPEVYNREKAAVIQEIHVQIELNDQQRGTPCR
ncbi:GrpB family protein [Variovorax sp. ZS18.2.2]|uniref:GrpB family protein n=1 Tax=Variovorax sp. ZS18.2.2 TaxID=2971255 RepID=UPI0021516108|nr:GrpB family protein [Variovorax sp. ZS18.2.2]MCR6477310.1 GrpB family protein [Variovorax sp. ZS18.2.2]